MNPEQNNLGAPVTTPGMTPPPAPGPDPLAMATPAPAPMPAAAPAPAPAPSPDPLAMATPAPVAPAQAPVDPFASAPAPTDGMQMAAPTDPAMQTPDPNMGTIPPIEPMTGPTPGLEEPKKKGSNKILLIVAGVALVVGIAFVVMNFLGKDNNAPATNTPATNILNNQTPGNTVGNTTGGNTTGEGEGSNEGNGEATSSTYRIKSGEFYYTMLSDLAVEMGDDEFFISAEDGSWTAHVKILSGVSYEDVASGIDDIKEAYEDEDFTVENEAEETYGEVAYVTFEVTDLGENILVAYTNAADDYVFGIDITTEENDFNYDILEDISEIFAEAEYDSFSSFSDFDLEIGTDAVS